MTMRRTPPGMLGTGHPVTMVVTDIENSTALWDADPDGMLVAQEMHDTCLRQVLQECFGYEVFTEGDSFTVTFHEANDALKWCSLVQQRLNDLDWPIHIRNFASLDQAPDLMPTKSFLKGKRQTLENILCSMETTPDITKAAISPSGPGIFSPQGSFTTSVTNPNVNASDLSFTDKSVETLSFRTPKRVFAGLRVRMGVHTALVEQNLQRHAVTNRVIYPHDLIHITSLVQDTPCGGQVVLSS
eukprot:CAMPEP_0198201712 /NCGR_PEP_ID=MMETSP1445-20131203/4693_1 /TAXON_ID=36898 /ORGANISM="Pyramimonas sp., Strain CCMP2087" /LENGTH=242 /DNA_ID=CAMNT_0043872267 /DNA_START=41 /DNA_END=766 /DNA_ORIENTATION=-